MGGMGLIFTPVLVTHLLGLLGLSGPMTCTFGFIDTQTVLLKDITCLQLPNPLPPAHTLIHTIRDITAVVEKVTQNPAVSATIATTGSYKH